MLTGSPDDELRTRLAARLQEFLGKLRGPESDGDDVADKIGAASDDEIFDFIDNELGMP